MTDYYKNTTIIAIFSLFLFTTSDLYDIIYNKIANMSLIKEKNMQNLTNKKPHIKPLDCSDCKYFIQHYRKGDYDFQEVYCGHCIHEVYARRFKKLNKKCEYFELINKKLVNKQEHNNIKKIVNEIHTMLSNLTLVVSAGNEKK